jgi:hypothetical protein
MFLINQMLRLIATTSSPTTLESDRRYRTASPEIRPRSSSRYVKRILSRKLQRQAALDLNLRDDLDSQVQDVMPMTRMSPVKSLILPVIEPSTFLLQNFSLAEWVTIQRHKKRIAHRCISMPTRSMRGPRMHEFSFDRASVKWFHSKANSCFSRSVIPDRTGVDSERLKVHLPSCVVLVINDNPYGLMFSLSLIWRNRP